MINQDPHATANAVVKAAFSIEPTMSLGQIQHIHPTAKFAEGHWKSSISGGRPSDTIRMGFDLTGDHPRNILVVARCPVEASIQSTEGSISAQLNSRFGTALQRKTGDGVNERSWKPTAFETLRFKRSGQANGDGVVTTFTLTRTFDQPAASFRPSGPLDDLLV